MSPYRLPRLIGAARARELILLGEPIDARTAERYGLVNRAVPAADFERELDAIVGKLVALPGAGVRTGKVLTARAFELPFDAFRREMQAHFKVCLDSDEHRRAMDEIRARRRAQKGAPS
jgi:enoyl-CoA hydratase